MRANKRVQQWQDHTGLDTRTLLCEQQRQGPRCTPSSPQRPVALAALPVHLNRVEVCALWAGVSTAAGIGGVGLGAAVGVDCRRGSTNVTAVRADERVGRLRADCGVDLVPQQRQVRAGRRASRSVKPKAIHRPWVGGADMRRWRADLDGNSPVHSPFSLLSLLSFFQGPDEIRTRILPAPRRPCRFGGAQSLLLCGLPPWPCSRRFGPWFDAARRQHEDNQMRIETTHGVER